MTQEISNSTTRFAGDTTEGKISAMEMDDIRQKNIAYEYLCHLEEAKKWLEACLKEELPPTTELEECLRNGVYLAKLGHFTSPEAVPLNKIYDIDQEKYRKSGLQFRHTDNVNYWLKSLEAIGLPLTFRPETTDVYDRKNMPRTIYCLHALSTHLFKLGKAPKIKELYGKVQFTDEEIDNMSKELKKYGIQMPMFQKIGGILTKEVPGDEAAVHAAVIAINEAIDKQVPEETLKTLQNPLARINKVHSDLASIYQETLYEAKCDKVQSSLNKSLNGSYEADIYDELLTQGEIQGFILMANVMAAWNEVLHAVETQDYPLLIKTLTSAGIKNVKATHGKIYATQLISLAKDANWNNNMDACEWNSVLQKIVSEGNNKGDRENSVSAAVDKVNKMLAGNSYEDTLEALKNPLLKLDTEEFAAPLYHEEMKNDLHDLGGKLTHTDINASVKVLNKIATVTKAVLTKNPKRTMEALFGITEVGSLEEAHAEKYCSTLNELYKKKQRNNCSCLLLTYMDILDCIESVNLKYQDELKILSAVTQMNEAVQSKDKISLSEVIDNPILKLPRLLPKDSSLCLKLLLHEQMVLHGMTGGKKQLSLEKIKECIEITNTEAALVQKVCKTLNQVNIALRGKDKELTTDLLKLTELRFSNVMPELKNLYAEELIHAKKQKNTYPCPWITFRTKNGFVAYVNVETVDYSWEQPLGFQTCSQYLSLEEIEGVIASVNQKYKDQHIKNKNSIKSIIQLQAYCRGYIQRKKVSEMLAANQLRTVKNQEQKIVKIQACWRGYWDRKLFTCLMYNPNPPMQVVRHFVHLLDFNIEDYEKELKLETLKGEVVQSIKHNQQLAQQLDDMDVKIGLLVQNRITLQDVVAQGKKLHSLAKEQKKVDQCPVQNLVPSSCKGLKGLTKQSKKMLESYQHLFYLLQTRPIYLSRLIFCLPQSKTAKFLETVILTLHSYASDSRAEYLLLNLLQSALKEEIRLKYQRPGEVMAGNPLTLTMAVNYSRKGTGKNSLRSLVGPLVEEILKAKDIFMNTNPVEIYMSWINEMESKSGEASNMPYSVTQEQALSYEEVRKRLKQGIKNLEEATVKFLTKITQSRDKIPYGILFMAKVLRNSLRGKFPEAPRKDILKVVGNFIYYNFINSAIVAPDAFDIISLSANEKISSEQRKNLASIAKILQFSASKRGFGEESKHLTSLNPFIIDCHEKFKRFFQHCCEVEDLEEHFNIHQYSEAMLISKPAIYITPQEMCDTHQLLLDYEARISSGPTDPLSEILRELGSKPSVAALLGVPDEESASRLAKSEVCLLLVNKYEVPESDETMLKNLLIKTKEMLVATLPFLDGVTLLHSLSSVPSPRQEEMFRRRQKGKESVQSTETGECSLQDYKKKIAENLKRLEKGGCVTRRDGYQTIISAIAKDICNKGKYRQFRTKEVQTLTAALVALKEKTVFYEEQVKYYNNYIQKCLENLTAGKSNIHGLKQLKHSRKVKSKMTMKFSAPWLCDKGILLEIEGLAPSEVKQVQFEITPTETNGIFEIIGKFMGVEMEKVKINIQELLQMQYEGVAVTKILSRVKVNVNLLIFLINTKFYGKS